MKVVLMENGDPPAIASNLRLNARAGGKALVDIMAPMDYADVCTITLDWVGDTITPAVVINTFKFFPQYLGQRLEHNWVLDMDDLFGKDLIDNDGLRVVADSIREEFERVQDERNKR